MSRSYETTMVENSNDIVRDAIKYVAADPSLSETGALAKAATGFPYDRVGSNHHAMMELMAHGALAKHGSLQAASEQLSKLSSFLYEND